ncbi:MAG: ABC transporter permease [Bacilli bacterium]|nr:ABC transporter permease [Bacilli bacterium]
MFAHNFKYILKTLFKNKGLIFWTFIFPIVLGLLFNLAFKDIEKNEKLSEIKLAIVGNLDEYYDKAFKSLEEDTFKIKYTDLEKAKTLLQNNEIDGYITYEEDFDITIKSNGINQTIIKYMVDKIKINKSLVEDIASSKIEKEIEKGNTNIDYNSIYVDSAKEITNKININDTSSKHLSYTMIEYYTLIAMSCLYGGILSMYAINITLPNLSSKGKRISVAPLKKSLTIISSLTASYLASLIGLTLLFIFTIFIIKVDYGDNLLLVILLTLAGSLAGLSLGLFVGIFIKGTDTLKTSILIAITMLFSFLSGMMGITMKYVIDTHAKILNIINPCNMITDGLYAIYYYDSLNRYYFNLISLLIFSLTLIIISCISLRRKAYDNI